MTKIRSRDSRMIEDRRGQSGTGGGGGGLGDILGGALGGGTGRGGGGLGDILGGALGGRSGGGMGGLKAGGGMIGILVLLATLFLPKLLGGAAGQASPLGTTSASSAQSTGGDDEACSSEAEQILCGATIDVQEFWGAAFPQALNQEYEFTRTVFFSGFTNTGCGQASSQTGPFYCPADKLVYFDLDFLAKLQSDFGAPGDLAAQYIVAHEYGHHIQNVLGINAQMRQLQQRDPGNANKYSVALELQADCMAGVWARSADDRGLLEPGEIEEALTAAAAVGDDRIQQQTQGRVDKEAWTHGSSAQRQQWFNQGYNTANINRCNTFDEVGNF